jgi:response regulator NasT
VVNDPNKPAIEALSTLTGKRVVICEDESVIQMQLSRALTRAGLTVVGSAVTGEEAVEVTLRERPDLVLMDIQMPGMDGLEATRRILQTYTVCIIVLTAFPAEHEGQAREIGACGYILKPITRDMLLPKVEELYAVYQKKA